MHMHDKPKWLVLKVILHGAGRMALLGLLIQGGVATRSFPAWDLSQLRYFGVWQPLLHARWSCHERSGCCCCSLARCRLNVMHLSGFSRRCCSALRCVSCWRQSWSSMFRRAGHTAPRCQVRPVFRHKAACNQAIGTRQSA